MTAVSSSILMNLVFEKKVGYAASESVYRAVVAAGWNIQPARCGLRLAEGKCDWLAGSPPPTAAKRTVLSPMQTNKTSSFASRPKAVVQVCNKG